MDQSVSVASRATLGSTAAATLARSSAFAVEADMAETSVMSMRAAAVRTIFVSPERPARHAPVDSSDSEGDASGRLSANRLCAQALADGCCSGLVCQGDLKRTVGVRLWHTPYKRAIRVTSS